MTFSGRKTRHDNNKQHHRPENSGGDFFLTTDFKENRKSIFSSIPFDIDQEDWLFKDELHKTMLSGIFERNIADSM